MQFFPYTTDHSSALVCP